MKKSGSPNIFQDEIFSWNVERFAITGFKIYEASKEFNLNNINYFKLKRLSKRTFQNPRISRIVLNVPREIYFWSTL